MPAIASVTAAAFAREGQAVPGEARLVEQLRASDAWLPALSLVAVDQAGEVVGHVVCSRGQVGSAPVLGLGPLSVRPDQQRRGVGSTLVHAVLAAAEALDEPLVALLGDPAYYARFGFEPSTAYGIEAPTPDWAQYFQVRVLSGYDPELRGGFTYPKPFYDV